MNQTQGSAMPREKKKANKRVATRSHSKKKAKQKQGGRKPPQGFRHTAESSHFPGLILGGGEAIRTTGDLGVGVTLPGVSPIPLAPDLPRP